MGGMGQRAFASHLAVMVLVWCYGGSVRGQEGETFTCSASGRVIPSEYVNDNYCDCPEDGSDEPRTGACTEGKFECDAGHEKLRKVVWSSVVNDGICDCCDGSDEFDGRTQCEDKCGELLEKVLREELLERERREVGHQVRQTWVQQGTEAVEGARGRRAALEAEKEKKAARVETLETRVREEEQAEEEEREALRAEHEREFREALGLPALSTESLRELLVGLLVSGEEQAVETAIDVLTEELGIPVDDVAAITVAVELGQGFVFHEKDDLEQQVEVERTNLERARSSGEEEEEGLGEPSKGVFATLADLVAAGDEDYGRLDRSGEVADLEAHIADLESELAAVVGRADEERALWEAAKVAELTDALSLAEVSDRALLTGLTWRLVAECKLAATAASKVALLPDGNKEAVQKVPLPNAAAAHVREEARIARVELGDAEDELRNLEDDLDEVSELAEMDFGAEHEFYPLHDECFSINHEKYEYKVCFFDTAKQDRTKLGKFDADAWASDKTTVRFTGGQWCMDKSRTATVHLQCGKNNEMVSVTEPERCEYEFLFRTPALCTL
mmetsp:Transcript_35164/g.99150  ORF Transcript_35164/g.99150 Transcript_35164/m.99150 type:complete len:562 (-) Transcript_35164:74-1759(-)